MLKKKECAQRKCSFWKISNFLYQIFHQTVLSMYIPISVLWAFLYSRPLGFSCFKKLLFFFWLPKNIFIKNSLALPAQYLGGSKAQRCSTLGTGRTDVGGARPHTQLVLEGQITLPRVNALLSGLLSENPGYWVSWIKGHVLFYESLSSFKHSRDPEFKMSVQIHPTSAEPPVLLGIPDVTWLSVGPAQRGAHWNTAMTPTAGPCGEAASWFHQCEGCLVDNLSQGYSTVSIEVEILIQLVAENSCLCLWVEEPVNLILPR